MYLKYAYRLENSKYLKYAWGSVGECLENALGKCSGHRYGVRKMGKNWDDNWDHRCSKICSQFKVHKYALGFCSVHRYAGQQRRKLAQSNRTTTLCELGRPPQRNTPITGPQHDAPCPASCSIGSWTLLHNLANRLTQAGPGTKTKDCPKGRRNQEEEAHQKKTFLRRPKQNALPHVAPPKKWSENVFPT